MYLSGTVNLVPMIGDEDKYGVIEPRSRSRFLDEISKCPVGVTCRVRAVAKCRVPLDVSLRKFVGTVVRDCKHSQEKGLFAVDLLVHRVQGFGEQVLVGNSPGGRKRLMCYIVLVPDTIKADAPPKRPHVLEGGVASV